MPKAKKKATLKASEEKWGKKLMAAGFTLLPSTIFEQQHKLKLEPVEFNILLQLLRHWWRASELPYPSIKSIAKCIRRSDSVVQRGIKKLEKNGLIGIEHRYRGHGGQTSSWYSFDGLIEAAEQALEEREGEERKKSASGMTRKRRTRSPSKKKRS